MRRPFLWAPLLGLLLMALVLTTWQTGSAQAQDYGLRSTELAIDGMT